MSDEERELLRLTEALLDSIAQADWAVYQQLCDVSLTAFEPEAMGQLVEGLPFHQFYFRLDRPSGPRHSTICSPNVRVMGDVGLVTYVRLTQGVGANGVAFTTAFEETRVWQRRQGQWKLIHFHRSSRTA
jgi:calcium/calmodulin-dependent protein kinase (CaM kinase) II